MAVTGAYRTRSEAEEASQASAAEHHETGPQPALASPAAASQEDSAVIPQAKAAVEPAPRSPVAAARMKAGALHTGSSWEVEAAARQDTSAVVYLA